MTSLLLWRSILMDNKLAKTKRDVQTKAKQINTICNRSEAVYMCRICNQENGTIPIFENPVSPNIPEEIHNFSGIKVEHSDSLSNLMCQNCLDLLNGCILFKEMCRKTNKMIIELNIMKEEYVKPEVLSRTEGKCTECNDQQADIDRYSIPSPNYSVESPILPPRRTQCRKSDSSTESCLCDVCGKTLKSVSGLLNHRSIHEKIFPYKCDRCPYKGRSLDLLKTHKMSHLSKDQLPYKCTQCPTTASTASNLSKHMLGVHGRAGLSKKAFKCTFCERAFSYKHDLKRHIRQQHEKQNTVECDICFNKFRSSFDLPQNCLCDIKINNDNYNVSETYHIGSDIVPTDAHYDTYGNLFYVELLHSNDGYHFNINVVKFENTVPQKVPGLPEGVSYSIAVDVKQTKVYFGTGKGMYTYNYDTLEAVPVTNSSLKLDMIVVDNNGNKYVIQNVEGIEEFYLLDGDSKIRCQNLEALNELAIDDKNNFYFIKENKLYMLKSRLETPTCIGNVNYGGNAQISFHKNNIFIASDKLSYFHENDTENLKSVDNVPGSVTAIAFDHNGEFVLGIQGKILKYKKNECYLRNNKVIDEYSTAL